MRMSREAHQMTRTTAQDAQTRTTRPSGRVTAPLTALAAALVLVAASCSSEPDSAPAPTPSAEPPATATSAPAAPAVATPTAAPTATQVSVGVVAGRLGSRKRAEVKQAVTAVVDRYVEGAWLGAYPRTDFTAAFADFRAPARRDARRDLSVLTLAELGTQVAAVTPTRRRLRIDVLAPRGRSSAATARLTLDLGTTGAAGEPPGSVRVRGSLLLSNQRGAWKVFGYDLRPEVRP